jgi:outer membrane protein TolC
MKLLSLTVLCIFAATVRAEEGLVLTLAECREMALKNNLSAQNADLSIEAAERQRKEAFTKYFPSISATGVGFTANKPMMSMDVDLAGTLQPLMEGVTPLAGWLMQQGAPVDPAALEGLQQSMAQPYKVEAMRNGTIGAVMAMQPVYAGGQIVNGNRLARAGAEVSRLQRQMTENDVLLATERFFWQIVSLKEKVKTVESAEVMLARILKDVTVAVDAGLTTRNDLLRVELEQNSLESGKLKLLNALQILKLALAQHIGLDSPNFDVAMTGQIDAVQIVSLQERLSVTDASADTDNLNKVPNLVKVSPTASSVIANEVKQSPTDSPQNEIASYLAMTHTYGADHEITPPTDAFLNSQFLILNSQDVENRPEYKLLEQSVEVARLQRRMETGKILPTVAIGAGYNYMRFDLDKSGGMKNNFGMLFATVSVPITNWWGGSYAIKRKKLELLQAENTKRETTELLQQQMQNVQNGLNEAYSQVLLAQKSIASAEQNLKISSDNYNAGVTTLSDLLEAQNLVQQARDQHTEAATAYYIKLAEYKTVTGR